MNSKLIRTVLTVVAISAAGVGVAACTQQGHGDRGYGWNDRDDRNDRYDPNDRRERGDHHRDRDRDHDRDRDRDRDHYDWDYRR